MTRPHEPAPLPYRAGLGPAECGDCGAATLAAPGYLHPKCDSCRRATLDALDAASSSPLWLATLATQQGMFAAEQRNDIEVHVARAAPAVVPVKIRILEPASTLPVSAWTDHDRVPGSARRLAMNATTYGRLVKLTYALAEDMTRAAARHIRSLCVRVWTAEGQRFGYAAYVDGRASSAVLWRAEEGGVRRCGVEEFAALATGQRWTPPTPAVVGPCPTCGRSVRWTGAGQPYKHSDCPGLQSS